MLLRREGVVARINDEGFADISVFQWKRAKRTLDGSVVFTVHSRGGAYARFRMLREHLAALVAIMLCVLIYGVASCFVFDVRIEGNMRLTNEQLAEELCEAGLYVGAPWKGLSFSEVEGRMLDSSDGVAWLNIYRRGNVAYVTVKEKEGAPDTVHGDGYANIISKFDAVIEEVALKRGSVAVENGQSVKKGELLISAFDAQGHPTYAEGEVYGRVYGSFSVFIPREERIETEKEYVLVEKTVNIFNFSINIFKKYGNLYKECDIIEGKRRIMLLKDKPLPITVI